MILTKHSLNPRGLSLSSSCSSRPGCQSWEGWAQHLPLGAPSAGTRSGGTRNCCLKWNTISLCCWAKESFGNSPRRCSGFRAQLLINCDVRVLAYRLFCRAKCRWAFPDRRQWPPREAEQPPERSGFPWRKYYNLTTHFRHVKRNMQLQEVIHNTAIRILRLMEV